MTISTKEVEWAAVHRSRIFGLDKSLAVIPNVSYGAFYWGEADLVAVSHAGYLTEGEVKVSISDLHADFRKRKYSTYREKWLADIKKHYFIVPEGLKEKALKIIEEKGPNSGLIYVSKSEKGRLSAFVAREAKANKMAKKMETARLLKLCRLICFRYWGKHEL